MGAERDGTGRLGAGRASPVAPPPRSWPASSIGLAVRLLGHPELDGPDGPVRVRSRKGQALLWYLASQPGRRIGRDQLATLLWEDSAPGEGRHVLTTVLSGLRDALPVFPVVATRETLAWDPEAPVALDTEAFLARAGSEARPGGEEDLLEALGLWRGPFLEGFAVPECLAYEEWLRSQRHLWQERLLAVLAALVRAAEAREDWAAVAARAAQALAVDPVREPFHRARMRALAEAGDRAAALVQFEACRRALEEGLGVEPEAATWALRAEIAGGGRARGRPRAAGWADPPAADAPFVGREDLIRSVEAVLREASAGGRRVALLWGEVGIGKTRLLEEVVHRQAARGAWSPLVGRCHETTCDVPYAPVADLLGLEAIRSGPDRARCWEEAVQLLEAMPRRTLLAVDDVHWSDEATRGLLAHLVRTPRLAGRLAVLLAARPEDTPPEVTDLLRTLERERRLAWLEVGPLSLEDVEALVAALVPGQAPGLAERVHVETRGNALFAVEVLRALREAAAGAESAEAPLPLPPTLQAVLAGRLRRLPAAAQALLAAASAFPDEAPYALVREVAGLGEAEGLEALEVLVAARFLQEHPVGARYRGWAGPALRFGHELVRRAVEAGMSRSRWQLLHRRAFACLEGLDGPADALAYHALEGELLEQAATWAVRAADGAERACAYRSATRWLEAALASLERLPPSDRRRREAVALRLRASLLAWSTDPATGARQVAGLEDAGGASEEAEVLVRRVEALLLQGRLGTAASALERALPLVRRLGLRGLLAVGLLRLAQLRALAGDLEDAVGPFEESAALLEDQNPHLYAQAVGTLASTLATLGAFGRARALLEGLEARGHATGHRSTRILSAMHRLTVEVLQERWEAAAEAGQAMVGGLRTGDHEAYEYIGTCFLGLPLARLGDLAGGIGVQERALELGRRIGLRILRDRALAYLAGLYLEDGRVEPAQRAVREGERVAQEDGYRYGIAFHALRGGEVAWALGDREGAHRRLLAARDGFAALGARPDVVRVLRRLCEVAPTAAERARHRGEAEALGHALGLGG
jgi:DNA-binding SARP family transcriptional activator/tetratricopeptide (TPR) repeat protein